MKINEDVKRHMAALEVAGRLTPEAVVEDAKREDSPLHAFFNWNMESAAESHWLDRARQLIRAVKVVIVRNEYTFKAPFYVPDPSKGSKEQGYTSLVTLKRDPVAARESLMQECERAAAILRRARSIALALGLDAEIESVLERLTGFAHHIASASSEDTQPHAAVS